MKSLHIIFKGEHNSVENIVDEAQYEKIYKPKGWEIVEETKPSEEAKTIEELKTEQKVKNYTQAKNKKQVVFDDNLIKKDE